MNKIRTTWGVSLVIALGLVAGCGGGGGGGGGDTKSPTSGGLVSDASANDDVSATDFGQASVVPGTVTPCQYLPLVGNPTNSTICVDVPVNLTSARVVVNMEMDARDTNTNPPTPIGMRHMVQLASALKARVDAGQIDPEDIAIVGVFHGSAASWVLNNAWWQKQVPAPNQPPLPAGNPYASWLDQLLALKAQGINVQLELCGVTMNNRGWTNADVYPGVLVNQGAIGRLIALENAHFAFLHPGK